MLSSWCTVGTVNGVTLWKVEKYERMSVYQIANGLLFDYVIPFDIIWCNSIDWPSGTYNELNIWRFIKYDEWIYYYTIGNKSLFYNIQSDQ